MNNPPLVLIVDDHESQRLLFKLLAERLKITAHVVSSGAEAIEAIETYQFDAVLMDVCMPVMDGLDCTRKIREIEKVSGRHVPIIAATASCFPEDERRCLEAGMDDYLGKPFTMEELSLKLNKWTAHELVASSLMTFSDPPTEAELRKFRAQLFADLEVARQLAGPNFKELRTMTSALELIDKRIEDLTAAE